MKGQREGSKELGPLHENGLHHLDVLSRGLDRVPPNGFSKRLQEHLVGAAEETADDDALGIDEVAQAGNGDADLATGI